MQRQSSVAVPSPPTNQQQSVQSAANQGDPAADQDISAGAQQLSGRQDPISMVLDALLPAVGQKSQENSGSSPAVDKSLPGPAYATSHHNKIGHKVASVVVNADDQGGDGPPHGILDEKAAVASAPSPPQAMMHHLLMDADFEGQNQQQPKTQLLTKAILMEIQSKYDEMQQFCNKLQKNQCMASEYLNQMERFQKKLHKKVRDVEKKKEEIRCMY